MDRAQFREYIVRPALQSIGLWSESAESLVVGTALVESDLLYVRQKGGGPALSFFQIERLTYKDLKSRLAVKYPAIYSRILHTLNMPFLPQSADFLIGNVTAAAIFCRLKYYFSPKPLPDPEDFEGMATMWKEVYNTGRGAGNIDKAKKVFRSVIFDYQDTLSQKYN